MAYVITFGRTNCKVVKHLFRPTRKDALETANALSFVLMGAHEFKSSECHDTKRVEREGFFVEFNREHNSGNTQCS